MVEEEQQLMLLQNITRKTGVLHEAQVLQLKYWPLILTHGTAVEITYINNGLEGTPREVIFNITKTKGKKPKNFKKRLKLLDKYVKNLLGDDHNIVVKLKDKKVFG